jgi:hypothetical protein
LPLSKATEFLATAQRLYARQFQDVAVITTHWNPLGFKRLRATYEAWRPTIPFDVICMELVIGDAEPEIKDSVVIRGGPENLLWQKERMTNLAIERLPDSVKYVAWVDHDCVFEDNEWLANSIAVLDSGVDALQPYSKLHRLDQNGEIERSDEVSASWQMTQGPARAGSMPGLVWVATRDFLRRCGGLYEGNIVGGGDAVWFTGMTGQRDDYLDRLGPKMANNARNWMASFGGGRCGHVPGIARHLWHGKMKNRQYVSRDAIPRRYDYDPSKHIEVDDNGLLRFSPWAPFGLVQDVAKYFLDRKDDG